MDFLYHRRLWAALIPVVVIVSGTAGLPLTEDLLADFGDKVVALASSALAIWSLFKPKPAA